MFIIFWMLLAGAGLVVCLLALALWAAGRRSDKIWWRSLSAVPLSSLVLLFALTLGGFAWSILFPPSPSQVWKATFGYEPPHGVSAMQNAEDGYGDWAATYFKFRATPTAIRSIVAHGWQRSASGGLNGTGDGAPTWWHPQITPATQVFKPQVKRHDFNSEEETLTYNPATQEAYYFYQGLD